MTKKCTYCNQEKSLDNYCSMKNGLLGKEGRCKSCKSTIRLGKKIHKDYKVEDIEGEIWKDVSEFPNHYMVSNKGRIKSKERVSTYTNKFGQESLLTIRSKILKSNGNVRGYVPCVLSVDKVKYSRYVHRLVATEFINNEFNYPYINHIDCNPSNNNAENLEWCTAQGNMNHASMMDRFKTGSSNHKSKKVAQFSLSGVRIKDFDCAESAGRETGSNPASIRMVCNGRTKTANNFNWKFI